MLMGFAACVAIVVSLCLGGSITRLAALRLRAVWLIFLALGAQVLVITVLVDLPEDVVRVVHGLTYVLAGVFLLVNLRVPGLPLLGLGTACNAVTIALNGGVLPASAAATAAAGWSEADPQFANSDPALANPRLAVLGDNYVTPDWVPFSNVYSLGDVLIVLGIAVLVYRASRPAPAVPSAPAGHAVPSAPAGDAVPAVPAVPEHGPLRTSPADVREPVAG